MLGHTRRADEWTEMEKVRGNNNSPGGATLKETKTKVMVKAVGSSVMNRDTETLPVSKDKETDCQRSASPVFPSKHPLSSRSELLLS